MIQPRQRRRRQHAWLVAVSALALSLAQPALAQPSPSADDAGETREVDSPPDAQTPVLLWTPYPLYRVDPTTGTLVPTGDRILFAPYGADTEQPAASTPTMAPPGPPSQQAADEPEDAAPELVTETNGSEEDEAPAARNEAADELNPRATALTSEQATLVATFVALRAREAAAQVHDDESAPRDEVAETDDGSTNEVVAAPESRSETASASVSTGVSTNDADLVNEAQTSVPLSHSATQAAHDEVAIAVQTAERATETQVTVATSEDGVRAEATSVLLATPLDDGSGEARVFSEVAAPEGSSRESVVRAATEGASLGAHVADRARDFVGNEGATTLVAVVPADQAQLPEEPLREEEDEGARTEPLSAELRSELATSENEAGSTAPERPQAPSALPPGAQPLQTAEAPQQARIVVYEAVAAGDARNESAAAATPTADDGASLESQTLSMDQTASPGEGAPVSEVEPEALSEANGDDDDRARDIATGVVAGAVVVGASAGAAGASDEPRGRRRMQGRLVESLDEAEESQANREDDPESGEQFQEATSSPVADSDIEEDEPEAPGRPEADTAEEQLAEQPGDDAPARELTERQAEATATAEASETGAASEPQSARTRMASEQAPFASLSLPMLISGDDPQLADTLGNSCEDDATCNDGLYCNGEEFCDGGSCNVRPPRSDASADEALACTRLRCDEERDVITHIPFDSLCSDGLYCNGSEVCDLAAGGCAAGPSPLPEETLRCADYVCDEETRSISLVGDPELCPEGAPACGPGGCDLSIDACEPDPPICVEPPEGSAVPSSDEEANIP